MSAADELATVRLIDIPLDVHRRAAEHYDTLNRELALVAEDPDTAPARLNALSLELSNQFSGFTAAPQQQLAGAIDTGRTTISLEYTIPPDVADGAQRLDEMLDEVEAYCVEGSLLTLVAGPEIVAYRKWLLGEFVRQIRDGRPPSTWAEYRDAAAAVPLGDAPPDALASTAPPEAAPTGAAPAEARTDPVPAEGVEVVAVPGDLDLDGASSLRTALVEHIDQQRADIVVDLAACSFLDSVGLSLLLTTRARCIAAGGSLRVRNVSEQPARALELAGVLGLLTT